MKLYKKTRRGVHRNNHKYGMGVRLADPSRKDHQRIRSARRFIKMSDGVKNLTFLYEKFAVTGYGCGEVECIFREPQTLFERYGGKLCWKNR